MFNGVFECVRAVNDRALKVEAGQYVVVRLDEDPRLPVAVVVFHGVAALEAFGRHMRHFTACPEGLPEGEPACSLQHPHLRLVH